MKQNNKNYTAKRDSREHPILTFLDVASLIQRTKLAGGRARIRQLMHPRVAGMSSCKAGENSGYTNGAAALLGCRTQQANSLQDNLFIGFSREAMT